jgi:3-deoxy-D-manno-octulosonate 8-phosphate phosphatase (KDO 8-P phosphatase)
VIISSDLEISEAVLMRAKKIKCIVFDVDGVMTDGSLGIGDDGQEFKNFNSLDGLGMKLLKASGVQLAIITGRTSNVVKTRAESTGVMHFYQGVEDKLEAFHDLISKMHLQEDEMAFMGDDVVDAPAMMRCGLAITVPSGHRLIKPHAHYMTTAPAGRGAVREACELIMQAQGTLEAQLAPFFK